MLTILRVMLFSILCAAVCGGASPVLAQVILKPNGSNAIPLRTRALKAEVTIERQFATTHLTLTFQNETSERIEADFIYALPPDTLVTGFAYWYGQERVVARIMEKEEAAAIYEHITTRMHDPALIELVGKRTFRARIFPVMPNSDLKVEMTLVQTLASDARGAAFTLPLRTEKGVALDSVQVKVRVKADAAITGVTNNEGLPVRRSGDGYRLELTGTNYRPQKDLQVRLRRREQPLQAALYAAPTGSGDGYFALALTPDSALRKPTVHIQGVQTYEIVPARLSVLAAHRALTLFGRYKGRGPATVTLTGQTPGGTRTYRQSMVFGAGRIPNNLASRLWAAGRIEQLSAGGGHRHAVIALSKRYGLPSRYTSWLAVPKEEMERYEREIAEAKLEVVARRYVATVSNHRENSRTGRLLHAEFTRLCRRLGENPQEEMQSYLSGQFTQLAQKIVSTQHSAHPDSARIASMRAELSRLGNATGLSPRQYLADAERDWKYVEADRVLEALRAEHAKASPDTHRLQQLGERYIALEGDNQEYSKARVERLAVRAEQAKVSRELDAAQQPGHETQLAALRQRQEALQKREDELRARMGDPLLSIEAPADAQQVIVLMPGGEIKRLIYDPQSRRWQARFDIPTYAAEGAYVITVVIVRRDGTRTTLTVRYHVDLTPPAGAGRAQIAAGATTMLRLEIEASADTARVKALLPWGDLVSLQPSAQPHHFFALVPLPRDRRRASDVVTYILTDRAHNRTTLCVDMEAR